MGLCTTPHPTTHHSGLWARLGHGAGRFVGRLVQLKRRPVAAARRILEYL